METRQHRNWLSGDAAEVLHTVVISLVAILVLAFALAMKGWHGVGAMIAVAIGLITVRIVLQVYSTTQKLRTRSETARRAARQAEEHYVNILKRIVRFTELREGFDGGRSERIGRLCRRMAERMGMDVDKCHRMEIAGWLHDIGLLAVPEQILHKATRLSGEEFRSIRRHAEASYEVLGPLEMLADVLPAIRHHHERLNGTGYPDGLAGDEIPIEARILASADAYDALTHDRPHRPAMNPLEAYRELQRCSPAGYDPDCVAAIADIMNIEQLEEAMESEVAVEAPA